MSSTSYWADLYPDYCLRRLVLVSGALLLVAGVVMVCLIDGSPVIKVLGGIAWSGVSAYRLWQFGRAYAVNGILRLRGDGTLEVQGLDGSRNPATLCSGSFALQRFAWLRVSPADGVAYAELLRGDARESEEWRRFQVIWRHIGAHG